MIRIKLFSTPNCHDFDKPMLDACIERIQRFCPDTEQRYNTTIYTNAPDRDGGLEYLISITNERDEGKDVRPYTIGAIRRPGSTQIEFHS